jgi:hypothetical protein
MRAPWGSIVGGVVAVVGSVIWAVCLAIYQQVMEPSGVFVDRDGAAYPNLAENNTYWPREMRHLGILLALAGLIAIVRAAGKALMAAAALGVVWLTADLWLDRVDINGRSAAVWLAVAGCLGVAMTAAVSRGGTPYRWGPHLVAGTAAVLATASTSVTTPWQEPVTRADQVAIENAVTAMDITLAVGFMAVVVALLAPAMATVRARWLVAIGAAATLAANVLSVAYGSWPGVAYVGVLALAMTVVSAAGDVPLSRLLGVGGVTILLAPCLAITMFVTVAIPMGRTMTVLAGNPAVHGADTDLALALPAAIIGLALAAVSLAVIRYTAPAPEPAQV